MKTILFTGGGTSGHITPNIAIIEELKNSGYSIQYIGMKNSMEQELIQKINIPFHEVSGGKLRRYFDFKNLTDLFRIKIGFFQSIHIMNKVKPDLVFSKGGFVACPVVWAAWFKRVPVIIHESDMTPGLANKLSIPFCKKVCCSFQETLNHLPSKKGICTGLPVRKSMLDGEKFKGLEICKFTESKPVIVVVGGSQGSLIINNLIRFNLNKLLGKYQICHICGKGNIESNLENINGYIQFEYINEELPDLFAMADLIISRAGATTIFELLALKKLNILIPLSKKASRGDQIINAVSFDSNGYSKVIFEEDDIDLEDSIEEVFRNKATYYENMNYNGANSTRNVIGIIEKYMK